MYCLGAQLLKRKTSKKKKHVTRPYDHCKKIFLSIKIKRRIFQIWNILFVILYNNYRIKTLAFAASCISTSFNTVIIRKGTYYTIM